MISNLPYPTTKPPNGQENVKEKKTETGTGNKSPVRMFRFEGIKDNSN